MEENSIYIPNIAVIDTETNWDDQVMSLGIVISNGKFFSPSYSLYFIFDKESKTGGMYSDRLYLKNSFETRLCSRADAMASIRKILEYYNVSRIFAYNGLFDYKHLPELSDYKWFDIMKIAAYRQFNPYIPDCTPCFRTGRMKCDYGVENIIRLMTGNRSYCEMHNALIDALDELQIMRFLGLEINVYEEYASI